MNSADAWIAATALILSAPLVTNNPKDYRTLTSFSSFPPPDKPNWARRTIQA
ncbi:MAG: hypothetical protein WAM39_28260 [Bryobacteraceae bacterium]